jgi:transcriptional accessory protein Tex/SPT6
MKEKVAVATVQGKTYFLIVNKLREHDIPFVSLIPGESVPAKIKVVLTTEQEKRLVNHEKILIFHGQDEIDSLVEQVKVLLLGKEAFGKIVFGVDPGVAIGLVAVADGKVIEEGNCFSTKEVIDSILKVLRNVDFAVTSVSVKIGNGVPVYKELLKDLDDALPLQVALEVVSEAGTNKPLKENKRSRGVRHISSATRIAGRRGNIVPRRKLIAANCRTQ